MSQTKDRIIQVLVGYIKAGMNLNDLSLSQIAHEVEIGKSTLYEHFTSKEDMISSTYMYLLKTYENILLEDLKGQTFKAAFLEQNMRILSVMKDAKVIMEAIMSNNFDYMPALGQQETDCMVRIQDKMSQRFEWIMKLGITSGEIDHTKIEPTHKYIIQALIQGLLLQYVRQELDMSEEDVCELIYKHTLKAIN